MENATAWLLHAEKLLDQRRLMPAFSCFNLAERKGADADRCSAGRWMVAMLQGKFEEAWRESDAIRHRGAPDPHRFWNGESVRSKRVMVRCLHGFGDSVQFLRYLPALHRAAAHIILEVPPRMLDLARSFAAVDEVVTWGEQATVQKPQWDVQIEVTELPYFFRTRMRDLPLATSYMHLPQGAMRMAARVFGTGTQTRVGVVWSAGEWNPSRSMPIDQLREVIGNPDFAFWNLQGGEVRSQWSDLSSAPNLHDAPALCADAGLLPLAAFISQLDLVITVDTLAAHLAGALGRPTWLLLQHSADWRWMVNRDDSPWYPSVHIFRQTEQGNWQSVADQVRGALAEFHNASGRKAA